MYKFERMYIFQQMLYKYNVLIEDGFNQLSDEDKFVILDLLEETLLTVKQLEGDKSDS